MLKKIVKAAILLTAAVLLFGPLHAAATEPDGRQIMVLVDDRPDGDDCKSTMTMTLINKQGRKRIREMESFSKDFGKDKKSVMVFNRPADVKGTAFLSWEYDDPSREDDKWLYMPALKKVRRISGSSRKEYFMGSDFTYDDMGDRNVDEDVHSLLGAEPVWGHDCWKVESIPVAADDMYTRKVIWVSKTAHLVLKAEYYDKDGLLKIYRVLAFRKAGGFWTVFHSEMDNVSRSHKTVLKISSVQYNTGLKDRLFRVSAIQRGRIR